MATTATSQAVVDEIRKTRDTAARLANGDYPEDADHIRVLAGMIQELAEQVERLAGVGDDPAASRSGSSKVPSPGAKDAEAAVEEDQTPQDAPADPRNERT
jgi:hypothetical protein